MNKKTVSFVLAMVLSIGLGFTSMSSVFASNEWASQMADQTMPEYTIRASSASSGIGDQAAQNEAKYKLSQVFNYVAGIVTSAMDDNRRITLMSMGQAKEVLSYSQETGKWTPEVLNIAGLDWNEIAQSTFSATKVAEFQAIFGVDEAKATEMAKLYQFLLNAGVPESALKVTGTDADGNKDQDIQINAAWFKEAVDTLKQGLSHGITLNFGASAGTTCTVSQYGQEQLTYSADYTTNSVTNKKEAIVTETYYYVDGFKDKVVRLNLETEAGADGTTTLKQSYTVELFNEFGRPTTTVLINDEQDYRKLLRGELSNEAILAAAEPVGSENEDAKYQVINQVTYNPQTKTVTTTTDRYGNVTTYKGDVTVTHNKDGGLVSITEDLGNGRSVTETYGQNNAVDTRTFSQFGRTLYTDESPEGRLIDETGGPNTAAVNAAKQASQISNDFRTAVKTGRAALDNWLESHEGITVELYGSTLAEIKDVEVLRALFNLRDENNRDKPAADYRALQNKLLKMDNGISAVARIKTQTIAFTSTTSIFAPNGTTINGTFYPHGASVSIDGQEGLGVVTTVFDRGLQFMTFKLNTIRAAVDSVRGRVDPAVDGTLAGPQLSDAEIAQLFGLPEGSVHDGMYTDPNDPEAEPIAVIDEEGAYVNPTNKNQKFKDGYLMVTDEEGNVTKYAVVKDALVSVLNGEGANGTNTFESATGELILIDVTEMKEEDLPKAGQRALFMGNVREDINGHMTMAVDTSYSGGVVTDVATIVEIEKEIVAGLSSNLTWVKTNTAQNIADIALKGQTGAGLRDQWNALVATYVESLGMTKSEKNQEILEQLKKLKAGQSQLQMNF